MALVWARNAGGVDESEARGAGSALSDVGGAAVGAGGHAASARAVSNDESADASQASGAVARDAVLGTGRVALASNERLARRTFGAGSCSAVASDAAFVTALASTIGSKEGKGDAAVASEGVGAAACGTVGPAWIAKRG